MSIKKKFIIPAIIILLLFAEGCSISQKTGIKSLRGEMETIRNFINRKKRNISLIKNKKAGETGFYYIIDLQGVVLSHPRGLLVGSNFMRYNFIKKIIQARSGCIRYDTGKMQQLVFFIPLNEGSILCLSIPTNEVENSEGACEQIMP